MTHLLKSLFSIAFLSLFASCASELTAKAVPDANLSKDLTYFVLHHEEDNSAVNVDICEELNATGRKTTTGDAADMPEEFDVLVTYSDSWMWDITMYMLSLDIVMRDASTEEQIATGHSMATSMIREDQQWHARAVIKEIIKEVYPEEAAAMPDSED